MPSIIEILQDHGDIPANVADLQDHLGGIPLERISMMPPPGTATQEDVMRWKYCELVDGVIVVKATNLFKALLSTRILYSLGHHIRQTGLREYLFPSVAYRLGSHVIRLPDISYVTAETWGDRRLEDVMIGDFPPDLAIDFFVPQNTRREFDRKRNEYVAAGVGRIWTVDTIEQGVWETRPAAGDAGSRRLSREDFLEAPDLFPGFRLEIGEWFEEVEGMFAEQAAE